MKRVLLVLAALVLFAAAIFGLLLDGDRAPKSAPKPKPAASRSAPAPKQAPPADHIDQESRDALLEILREEGGE